MELETSYSLPTPTGTPYRTPSSSRSRRSHEYEDMSPIMTPPPDTQDEKAVKRGSSNDITNIALDEKISPLDPRRFTPTLHANLVSEILSLRRDLENKTKSIDQLEQSLQNAHAQNDTLNKTLLASNKEVRLVKRQMQLLEGGTLAAINDLSKERDDMYNETLDLRKRLEKSQKRAKSQEETADRTQALWERDKDSWAVERRALETKIHVVEGRLKVVLTEVANAQTTSAESSLPRPESRASAPESPLKRPQSELRDRRHSGASIASDHMGGRNSVLSFAPGPSTSLADELALEDIDEGISNASDDDEGRVSPDALPEERGRPASSLSIKARKVLGLPFDIEDMEHGEHSQSVADALNPYDVQTTAAQQTSAYIDAGVQYSRPGTPVGFSVHERDHTEKSTTNRDVLSLIHSEPASNSTSQSADGQLISSRSSMVSSSCQTNESLPSPPPTPMQNENVLATILESAFEKVETREMATQTEIPEQPARRFAYTHSRTDTDDLNIPTITIIPPASRPVTPESSVKLPPRTKNAGCQVQSEVLLRYTSTSMQTEEIRIDRRYLLTSHTGSGAFPSTQSQTSTSKSRPSSSYSRSRSQPVSNSALKRSAPPVPAIPSMNDNGPLTRDWSNDKARPVRSSSLFAGFDDYIDELEDENEDDMFNDDDVFNKPMAKFSLRSGKLVSQERSLEDIRELTAISAGEALALENIRQSEEMLPPELRGQVEAITRTQGLKRTTTIRRGHSIGKSNSIRRAAMISNGAAAHQHKHSQSTITSSEGGGIPPPIPVPLRYSSARLGTTFSEGGRSSRSSSNASPTRQGRRVVKPALRKARSGPALSPAASIARRQRSRSPPIDARISIVPEMPVFNMPDTLEPSVPISLINGPQEASAPRPSVATGPGREGHHAKSTSDAPLMHQTSVVDAIAQTMVGEWMYKYVRRRKSFGKLDKDWDPSKSADELIHNSGNAGVRHKRWVWVAPYERAIMWSSKQPMNGTALMGKAGRKLTIKSVLDVKDENPMPKGSVTGPPFNRSILILTPQRALKFTATSQERHYVWLTALSFLSHSPLSLGDLAALPPPPEGQISTNSPPSMGGSLRRRNIRDSIRIAKAPGRPTVEQRAFTTDGVLSTEYYEPRPSTQDTFDSRNDAAVPPVVRRYHNRKRSNTAPKAPPSAFRSLPFKDSVPSMPAPSYSQSVATGSSEQGPYTPTLGDPSIPSTRRGSEASALGRPGASNFLNFDSNSSHNASMTMRMDAFIDNKQPGKGGSRNSRLSQGGKGHGARRDPAHWSFDENGMPSLDSIEIASPSDPRLRYSGSAGPERDYFRSF